MSLEGASKKNNDLCHFWGKGWVECVQILNAYTRFLVDPGNIHACVREKVKLRVNIWATLWWKQSCRVFNQGFSKDRLSLSGLQTRNDLVTAESFCLCSSVPSYHRLARPSVFPARTELRESQVQICIWERLRQEGNSEARCVCTQKRIS